MTYENKQELQARINGLNIALAQTRDDEIEYLGNAVRSIIATLNTQTAKAYQLEFTKTNTLSTEKIDCVENKRKSWREELARLMPLLKTMSDDEEEV